jgi:hypothetical protein
LRHQLRLDSIGKRVGHFFESCNDDATLTGIRPLDQVEELGAI